MAVFIAHADRSPMAGGRIGASDSDRLRAAATFQAYVGTFDVETNCVIHHVEANSFPNDAGVNYVRLEWLEGDQLALATPPDFPVDQCPMRLGRTRFRKP